MVLRYPMMAEYKMFGKLKENEDVSEPNDSSMVGQLDYDFIISLMETHAFQFREYVVFQ